MCSQLIRFGFSGVRRGKRRKSLLPNKVLVFILCLTACADAVPADQQPPLGGRPVAGGAAVSMTDDGTPLPNITSSIGEPQWELSANRAAAVLRMEDGPPLFSITCEADGNMLHFDRYAAAPSDGRSTLSLTSALRAASLPAASTGELGAAHWRASLPGSELPKAVFELFAGQDPVRITIADTTPVLAPPESAPTKALAVCVPGLHSTVPRKRT